MLRGGLPAAPGDQAPHTARPSLPQAPTGWKAPGIGKQRSVSFQFPALQPPHLVSSYFVLKVAFFVCFFFSIFLHLLLLYVICIFPKHVPSELHRRYTSLEEMLQSQSVWSPQLAWYWLICQRCHPTVLIYK